MLILDGRRTSEKIILGLEKEITKLSPSITVVLIGDNPASLSYVTKKRQACEQVGINFTLIELPYTISFDDLIKQIHQLNEDQKVNGYIIQLPLPDHLQAELPMIIREIDPAKDIDGFHAYNLGKMFISTKFEDLPPATPLGIIKLLEEYQIDVKGQEVVVVGHSNLVGKPVSTMLLNRNATVTTCHIDTRNLKQHTLKADILIVAVGKANLITADMVKEGVIIIDVGTNRIKDSSKKSGFRLVGDCDFDNLKDKAKAITPVPGGVGPMTVAALLINTVRATTRQTKNYKL